MTCSHTLFNFGSIYPQGKKQNLPSIILYRQVMCQRQILNNSAGWLKVIAGEYENFVSKIPSYSKQFLYHIHLEPGKNFSIDTPKELEYAVFLP
jgi:redox-sensitive bicupin YhaK (pirin superfamily)